MRQYECYRLFHPAVSSIRFIFLNLHTCSRYIITVNTIKICGVKVGQAPVKKIKYRTYSEIIINNIMNWDRGSWNSHADSIEGSEIFPLFSNIYHTFQEFQVTAPYSSIL